MLELVQSSHCSRCYPLLVSPPNVCGRENHCRVLRQLMSPVISCYLFPIDITTLMRQQSQDGSYCIRMGNSNSCVTHNSSSKLKLKSNSKYFTCETIWSYNLCVGGANPKPHPHAVGKCCNQTATTGKDFIAENGLRRLIIPSQLKPRRWLQIIPATDMGGYSY